jgi:hypothetical protein
MQIRNLLQLDFDKQQYFCRFAADCDPDRRQIDGLKDFLKRIIDWNVTLHPEFKTDLNESGFCSASSHALTRMAVGSPSQVSASQV